MEDTTPALDLRSFMVGALPRVPASVSHAVDQGGLTLLALVKLLGEYLTADDEVLRTRAILLLSEVLAGVSAERINKQAARVLTGFYIDKVEDAVTIFHNPSQKSVLPSSAATSAPASSKAAAASSPSTSPSTAAPPTGPMLHHVLSGLTTLSSLPSPSSWGHSETQSVSRAIFAHLRPTPHPHSFPQITRFKVLQLVDNLVARHREALKSPRFADEFLAGYAALLEGEKDPRNLLLAFGIDRVVLLEWPLGNHVEALFDITFCYFPITFRPPPDDPYGITTEDLKLALRQCLCATPLFAPLAMPLLLEKLAASGGNAKRDTLETLSACLPVYGKAAAQEFALRLWEGLKIEIFHATDATTEQLAEAALTDLLRTLYADENAADGIMPRIAADVLQSLEEPEKSMAKPAAKVAACAVRASAVTSNLMLKQSLELLLRIYHSSEDPSIRPPIFSHLAELFRALKDAYGHSSTTLNASPSPAAMVGQSSPGVAAKDSDRATSLSDAQQPQVHTSEGNIPPTLTPASEPPITQNPTGTPSRAYTTERPLEPFRDELLAALAKGLKAPSQRATALEALSEIVFVKGMLDPAELGFLVDVVNGLVVENEAEDVRDSALTFLTSLSRLSPKFLSNSTLPLLLSKLPDRIPTSASDLSTEEAQQTRASYRRTLSSLSRLCIQPDLFETLVVRLLAKLEYVCAPRPIALGTEQEAPMVATLDTAKTHDANVSYARALLATLHRVLLSKVKSNNADVPRYIATLAPRLFALAIVSARVEGRNGDEEVGKDLVARDLEVLEDMGKIVGLLVRSLGIEKQTIFAASLFEGYLSSSLSPLLRDISTAAISDSSLSPFVPLDPSISHPSEAQRSTVSLFSSAFVALKKDVPLPLDIEARQLLERMLEWLPLSDNEVQARAAFAIVAATVNKYFEALKPTLDADLEAYWRAAVVSPQAPIDRRRLAVKAWLWIAKALIVRGEQKGYAYIDAVLSLVTDPDLCQEAAKALAIVANAEDGVLTKENGAVIRLLHRQRFFTYIVPKVVQGYQAAHGSLYQGTYLVALSCLLPSMPQAISVKELPKLIPLLLRALSLPDAEARASSINTIRATSTAPEAKELVESRASELVSALLENSLPGEFVSAPVRIAALRCLAVLPDVVQYSKLHPQRAVVIRELGKAVDDRKRAVRREAVECRDRWFTYSG